MASCGRGGEAVGSDRSSLWPRGLALVAVRVLRACCARLCASASAVRLCSACCRLWFALRCGITAVATTMTG
jgi:hypothetical protein